MTRRAARRIDSGVQASYAKATMSAVRRPMVDTSQQPERVLVVSVVLYNPDLPKLEQCLQSVLTSTLAPGWRLEVQLVDHSSTPLDRHWLARVTDEARVNYRFRDANPGFGAGHNIVLNEVISRKLVADYALVLNPDAYFEPELLQELVQRMEGDQRIGLCIPLVRNPDGSLQRVNKRLPSPLILFGKPFLEFAGKRLPKPLRRVAGHWLGPRLGHYMLADVEPGMLQGRAVVCPFSSGCFMFLRAAVLRETGGFDERYFLYMEDLDLARRVRQQGLNVVFSDLTCFHHWERAAYKNKKMLGMLVRSGVAYFNKWGWLRDSERRRLNLEVFFYE